MSEGWKMLRCLFATNFQGKWNEKFPQTGLEPLPPVSSISSHTPHILHHPKSLGQRFTGLQSCSGLLLGTQVGRAGQQLPSKSAAASSPEGKGSWSPAPGKRLEQGSDPGLRCPREDSRALHEEPQAELRWIFLSGCSTMTPVRVNHILWEEKEPSRM